ncbi:MAG: hypothetical protein J7K08_07645 [Thermoplasmata archaeon]|nr:hypothetical protein [Thermoplasmata archaeon]OYT48198.1 MAG: hypothetical protein B6U83_03930 [Thermoplasmatales archaeon ex4484_36]HDD59338.1 hypothetical protein [Euryarchaeota archaeon]RLF54079.1 MAG: hypothetical protein DRN28_06015 [Thermoplasmata archaeon]RLF69701.1 MAG: hypothetical protein DRN40_06265 [Thermoplasmata archaeon]
MREVLVLSDDDSYLTPAEVAEILRKVVEESREKGEEETFEVRATLEHVEKIKRLGSEPAGKLISELLKFERINPIHAYKIAELMPRDEAELRPVFAKERFELSTEELKEILTVIDKYRE